MQVAVAGVTVSHRADTGALRCACDPVEQIGNTGARDDDVFGELVTGEGANGGRHLSSRGPQASSLRSILCDEYIERTPIHTGLSDALGRGFTCMGVAVDFDEQKRPRALVDGYAARAHGGEGTAVEQLEAARDEPSRDDLGDCLRGLAHIGKEREQRDHLRGFGKEPHRDLAEDGEGAFTAGEQRGDVIPGDPFDGALAHACLRAPHHGGLEPQDIVAGHAVFESARAARVFGDVAAYRAHFQRIGIGRVKEPFALDRFVQIAGDDPRFDHGEPFGAVDLFDARHPERDQNDAPGQGDGTSRATGAREPRGDRDSGELGHLEGAGDVVAIFSEDHRVGGGAVDIGIIGSVGFARCWRGDDFRRPEGAIEQGPRAIEGGGRRSRRSGNFGQHRRFHSTSARGGPKGRCGQSRAR